MLIRRQQPDVAGRAAPAPGVIAAAAAVLTAVVVTALGGCGNPGGESPPTVDEPTVITSTTKIAGAGVLGNQRRPDESCAPTPLPADPDDSPTRPVRHAEGETVVNTEPQRIVVLSGDQLDALCALGLQSRVVAAALPDESDSQPSYLGTVIHDVPAVGTRSTPDMDAIRAANPDLILGSQALTPDAYPGAVGDRPHGLHRRTRRGLGGQPAHGRRGDRANRRRERTDRRLHRGRGQSRCRQ